MASAIVHAAAAMTLGGVYGAAPRSPGHEPETLDVDVAFDVAALDPSAAPQAGTAAPAPVRQAPPRRPPAARQARPASTPRAADHDAPARFALSAGTVASNLVLTSSTSSSSTSSATGSVGAPSGEPAAAGEGDVDAPARLLASGVLAYPPAARQAEVEADLPLDIVVDVAGRVTSARVARRAGYGLDEAALRAIREYRFSPAMRGGRPVPVRMRWTVQFRLR